MYRTYWDLIYIECIGLKVCHEPLASIESYSIIPVKDVL